MDVTTWTINAETGASATYSNHDFDSYSPEMACRADGLYVLGGDDDDGTPIEATVDFGVQLLGTPMQKTVQYAYLGTSGHMALRLTANGQTFTYPARTHNPALTTQRVDCGRGLKATHIRLELTNIEGSDFDLASVQLMIATLTRRI